MQHEHQKKKEKKTIKISTHDNWWDSMDLSFPSLHRWPCEKMPSLIWNPFLIAYFVFISIVLFPFIFSLEF